MVMDIICVPTVLYKKTGTYRYAAEIAHIFKEKIAQFQFVAQISEKSHQQNFVMP